jgi:AAA domain
MSEANLVNSEIVGSAPDLVSVKTGTAKRWRMDSFVTLDQLERICKAQPANYVVEGLVPADDVHVAVGDSGLGKTPWAYQLGLCVAAGKTFLGHAVKQGRVLYYDLENGRDEILLVGRSLCGHLGITPFPLDFLVLRDEGNSPRLDEAVEAHHPILVIIDTLRAFRPRAEASNDEMASFIAECKRVARKHHCAILLLHHIKKPKPDEDGVSSLEITPILEWLLRASGARALVNQTNTRIAFDIPSLSQVADAALVMKSFVKVRGECGPFYLERVLDQGEPIGYRRMVGCKLLGNPDQEAAFPKLPPPPKQFTFKDAKFAYGKTDNPTRQWLKKCEAVGLVRHAGRGLYTVVEAPASPVTATGEDTAATPRGSTEVAEASG